MSIVVSYKKQVVIGILLLIVLLAVIEVFVILKTMNYLKIKTQKLKENFALTTLDWN